MDRLQEKCVIASVSLHALLAAVLLFGPAFLVPSSKTMNMDVLTVIPDILTDAPSSNPGGNPNVKLPPPPAPLVQPQPPTPTPPPKAEPVVKPEPIVPRDPTPKNPADVPDFTEPATKKPGPVVNPRKSTRKTDPRAKAADSTAEERAQARAILDARRRAAAALSGAIASVGSVVSSSTSVEIPGPGGQAYANYAQVVKSKYTEAWIVPADVDDDQATTKASVTIAKDGTVISARIIGFSGNAAVDASVRRTLDRVTFIAPFPVGAKEDERTFTISFNLKAKRQLG